MDLNVRTTNEPNPSTLYYNKVPDLTIIALFNHLLTTKDEK
jgi:hypothetical protein